MPKAPVKRFRRLPNDEQSRVIEMAWEDRTPFEVIETLFGMSEPDVIEVMRHQLKSASYRLWRMRVTGRATKHQACARRMFYVDIAQRNISAEIH